MKRQRPLRDREWFLNQSIWTTKEGVQLYPHEFEDEHLMNTIVYLANLAFQLIEYEEDRNLVIDDHWYWLAQKQIFRLLVNEAMERGLIKLEHARLAHWTLR